MRNMLRLFFLTFILSVYSISSFACDCGSSSDSSSSDVDHKCHCFNIRGIPINLGLDCEEEKFNVDYIVVGMGTAGAVVARKLSDDPQTSVLALHIGKNLTQAPLIKFTKNIVATVLSALLGNFPGALYITGQSIPQRHALDRELLWAMATPFGGASSINAGAWCRGTDEVYSQWEAIAGPNWSVARILDVYKRLENYHGQTPNPEFRGFDGPIDIRQVPNPTPVSVKFTNAIIQALGVPFVLDYNDPLTPIGASSQFQYTQKGKNGRLRVSSATAFLDSSIITPCGRGKDGRQLRVLFQSPGLRVLWQGNKAVGVEYLRNGKRQKAYASKGVIVCAGLYSSSFLMHSGVGPSDVLEPLNIPVVFDNPNVGQGLADQPRTLTFFSSNFFDGLQEIPTSPFDSIAWLPAPDGDPNVRKLRLATITQAPGLTLGIFDLVQPKSRGRIYINSADPLAPPVINNGMFNNEADLNLFKRGFRIYIKNINEAFKQIDPSYFLLVPDLATIDNDVLLTTYIKESLGSNMHFQSHCKMAPIDQGGVVDSFGAVYGVTNLYVADDSIVPLCMDGSPMASAYLIGANIAELLIGP